MQVESIAECLGAFCNTFGLHYAIIGLDKKNDLLLSGFTVQLSLMGVQKNNFRPIDPYR